MFFLQLAVVWHRAVRLLIVKKKVWQLGSLSGIASSLMEQWKWTAGRVGNTRIWLFFHSKMHRTGAPNETRAA
jgi:hypothetical protein